MFLGDFCKLNKTAIDGTCLGEAPGGFCDVGCCCCCFTSLEVFFLHCFLTSSLILPRAIAGFLHSFYTFSAQLIAEWFATLSFNLSGLTASVMVLSGRFLPTGAFLPGTPSLRFGAFCDSNAGRNTPSRILLCVYQHKVVLSGWRMVLSYSYCRYKSIGLPIAPMRHEV